jgi:hypothetical protein
VQPRVVLELEVGLVILPIGEVLRVPDVVVVANHQDHHVGRKPRAELLPEENLLIGRVARDPQVRHLDTRGEVGGKQVREMSREDLLFRHPDSEDVGIAEHQHAARILRAVQRKLRAAKAEGVDAHRKAVGTADSCLRQSRRRVEPSFGLVVDPHTESAGLPGPSQRGGVKAQKVRRNVDEDDDSEETARFPETSRMGPGAATTPSPSA